MAWLTNSSLPFARLTQAAAGRFRVFALDAPLAAKARGEPLEQT